MTHEIAVLKDEENQMPIPSNWRETFVNIVEAFINNDFSLQRGVKGVCPITEQDCKRIADNIADYGCQLCSLPDDCWQTSVCQWMNGYWDALIDLYTVEEGPSDLVLSVRVYEKNSSFLFEVQQVYVP